MAELDNISNNNIPEEEEDNTRLELYSIVLSATILFLAILFGGGGCITVIIAMLVHRMMRKLRFIIIGILLAFCCIMDFIWCPIEISCLILHHQNFNKGMMYPDILNELKYIGNSVYILLVCAIALTIVFICVQNLLKITRKYDTIPKLKLAIIFIFVWLLISVVVTLLFVLISYEDRDAHLYHPFRRSSFQFKIGIQTMWFILLLLPAFMMITLHLLSRFCESEIIQTSDLHSNDNFIAPSLIVKSVEDKDVDNEESSAASPSPDIQKDSTSGSPVSKTSKTSKSALKKRSGTPSSQKVVFAETPNPSKEEYSPMFGEQFKSQNHLGVNMAAILGRRRHTIAQISDPHLDQIQKSKTYNYVRTFSVDISALQAQLENPKMQHDNCPFHSQQDLNAVQKNQLEKNQLEKNQLEKNQLEKNQLEKNQLEKNQTSSRIRCKRQSRDEIIKSQEISEEPEIELENELNEINETKKQNETAVDKNDTQAAHSPSQSVRSFRDSICPTPPLLSLTLSDGEEKQMEMTSMQNNYDNLYPSVRNAKKLHTPCKLSYLLIATFILSLLPMFITELLREYCLSHNAFINIVTCMTAISTAQTMVYPQLIFCLDECINKTVYQTLMETKAWISEIFLPKQHACTNGDIFDGGV